MEKIILKFEGRIFNSLDDMSNTLLQEANEQIIKIDLGQCPNNATERNKAKFRLMHLSRAYREFIPTDYRSSYNSLWSQIYRLEHQNEYLNPYLQHVIEISNRESKSNGSKERS